MYKIKNHGRACKHCENDIVQSHNLREHVFTQMFETGWWNKLIILTSYIDNYIDN